MVPHNLANINYMIFACHAFTILDICWTLLVKVYLFMTIFFIFLSFLLEAVRWAVRGGSCLGGQCFVETLVNLEEVDTLGKCSSACLIQGVENFTLSLD